MIKINNKEYNNYDIEITWGDFDVVSNGEKRKGSAPFIIFNIENNIFIGIETIISKDMWKNMNLNTKVNIERYISDITYKDEAGWISIITGKYNCNILRISEKEFKIEFCVESEEIDEINIIIDDVIVLF